QGAAPGHPVAAGVVDDDQVGPTGLGALGRQAGPRSGADDQPAGLERGPEPGTGLGAGHRTVRASGFSAGSISDASATGAASARSTSYGVRTRRKSGPMRNQYAPG